MNKTHFMYLNSERLNSRLRYLDNSHDTHDTIYKRMCVYDDYIDLNHVPLSVTVKEYDTANNVKHCSYRVNIIDYLRHCGGIDTSICDDDNLDKLVLIHQLKDDDASHFREYIEKCHLDYYREIKFTKLWIHCSRFDFHMDEFKRLNTIHRLCTRQVQCSVNDTFTHCDDDSSTSLVCDDEQFKRDVVPYCDKDFWFIYHPQKEVFLRGKIKVEIPSISGYLDGSLTCDLSLPCEYIKACDIFLDMRLYFDCKLL